MGKTNDSKKKKNFSSMFIMSRQVTRRKTRLNKLMESRILGDGYVRFGGRFRETYYSNIVQGARSRAYFLTTSHDGFGSMTAAFTPIRVVCQNTLNAALKHHTNCIKIRHTSSAQDRLTQAHQLLGITRGTLYGAYNAVTGYFQNVRNYKDDKTKFKCIMYGIGAQRSQTAFNLCLEFAQSGAGSIN